MKRLLIAAVCVAVVFACFGALKAAVARGVPLADVVIGAVAVTLFLAVAATGFALRALTRARQAQAEILRLARSVDMAVHDLAADVARNAPPLEPERPAAPAAPIILAPPADEAPRPIISRYQVVRTRDSA